MAVAYNDGGEYLKSKHVIAHVNNFCLQTANFLIRFSADCESRLETFNRQIHRLESALTILEANLGSYPFI